ncbi:MAG: hypothetical protein DVB23_001559, partial [Verrucomicrobia bacterium]
MAKKSVLLIVGDRPEAALAVAGKIARHGDFKELLQCNSWDLREDFKSLFTQLARHDQTADCLILEAPMGWLESRILVISRALAGTSSRERFGLLICTVSEQAFRQEDAGEFPENLEVLRLPSSKATAAPSPALACDAYTQIFRPSHAELDDLVAATESSFIERALVRTAVILGPLPVQDFEAAIVAVLKEKEIKFRAKSGTGQGWNWEDLPALDLWRSAKEHFLNRVALTRDMEQSPQRIEFASAAHRDLAEVEAWRDPEAMTEVFLRVSSLEILFDERAYKERRELFDAYINAAVAVSRRSPKLFGNRWLAAVLIDYMGWVASRTATPGRPGGGDLFAFFDHLVKSVENARERKRLWEHFCERVGYLCECLSADDITVGV